MGQKQSSVDVTPPAPPPVPRSEVDKFCQEFLAAAQQNQSTQKLDKIRKKYKVTLNEHSTDLKTVLIHALESKVPKEAIVYLLSNGANINISSMIRAGITPNSYKPFATPLSTAFQHYPDDDLILLLIHYGANLRLRDNWLRTPLHLYFWDKNRQLNYRLYDNLLYYTFYDASKPIEVPKFDPGPDPLKFSPAKDFKDYGTNWNDSMSRFCHWDPNKLGKGESPIALLNCGDIHGNSVLRHAVIHPHITINILRSLILSGAAPSWTEQIDIHKTAYETTVTAVVMHFLNRPDIVRYFLSSGYLKMEGFTYEIYPYLENDIMYYLYRQLKLSKNADHPSLLHALSNHHSPRIRAYFNATFYTYPQTYYLTYGVFPWFKLIPLYQAVWLSLYSFDRSQIARGGYAPSENNENDTNHSGINRTDIYPLAYQKPIDLLQYYHHFRHNDLSFASPTTIFASPQYDQELWLDIPDDSGELLTKPWNESPRAVYQYEDTTENHDDDFDHYYNHDDDDDHDRDNSGKCVTTSAFKRYVWRHENTIVNTPVLHPQFSLIFDKTSQMSVFNRIYNAVEHLAWYQEVFSFARKVALMGDTLSKQYQDHSLSPSDLHQAQNDSSHGGDNDGDGDGDDGQYYHHAEESQQPSVLLHRDPTTVPMSIDLSTNDAFSLRLPFDSGFLDEKIALPSQKHLKQLAQQAYSQAQYSLLSPYLYSPLPQQSHLNAILHRLGVVDSHYVITPHRACVNVTYQQTLELIEPSQDYWLIPSFRAGTQVYDSTHGGSRTIRDVEKDEVTVRKNHRFPFRPRTNEEQQRCATIKAKQPTDSHEMLEMAMLSILGIGNQDKYLDFTIEPSPVPVSMIPMTIQEYYDIFRRIPQYQELEHALIPSYRPDGMSTAAGDDRHTSHQPDPNNAKDPTQQFGREIPDLRFIDAICTNDPKAEVKSNGLFWYALDNCQPSLDDIHSLFLSGCDPSFLNSLKQTTLMGAIIRQWPEQAILWFTNVMTYHQLTLKDSFKRTIFHYVFLTGRCEELESVWKMWSNTCTFDPFEPDSDGHTVLSYAVMHRASLQVFRSLSDHLKQLDRAASKTEKKKPTISQDHPRHKKYMYQINLPRRLLNLFHKDDPLMLAKTFFREERSRQCDPCTLSDMALTFYRDHPDCRAINSIIKSMLLG